LKIALLSRRPDIYANKRIAQAAIEKNCALSIIDPLSCTLLIQNSRVELMHPEFNMSEFDFVLPRFGPIWQRQGNVVLKRLEEQGILSLNNSHAIAQARDKWQCFHLFQKKSIPFPKSAFVESIEQIESVLQNEFCFPVLLKQINSAQGRGVAIFHNKNDLLTRASELYAKDEAFMIQEFIAEAAGVDYRLFVLNGQVIASMQRTAIAGDFRANIHLGADAKFYVANAHEVSLAIQATFTLGLDVAGVDIIYGKDGPLVLEVNACPGFEALERVSGINIAEKMLELTISRK
jgi:ribosomal protein S6--L-glutamate ligase